MPAAPATYTESPSELTATSEAGPLVAIDGGASPASPPAGPRTYWNTPPTPPFATYALWPDWAWAGAAIAAARTVPSTTARRIGRRAPRGTGASMRSGPYG